MLNYLCGLNVITRVLYIRKRDTEEDLSEECNVRKTQLAIAGFEDVTEP